MTKKQPKPSRRVRALIARLGEVGLSVKGAGLRPTYYGCDVASKALRWALRVLQASHHPDTGPDWDLVREAIVELERGGRR